MCDSHRGISLLSIAEKTLAHIVLNRMLEEVVDSIYPELQCGFRAGRGTADMIFAMRQIRQKYRESSLVLYMVLIDPYKGI